MAKLYAKLVQAGKWTLDDVPARWLEQVEELLNSADNA